MSQTNGIIQREDFKIACNIFQKAFNPKTLPSGAANQKYDPTWDPVSAFRLTQSRLRLEQPLVTTSAQYLFPVLSNIQNQAQQFPSEVRLNLQDSFVPTRVGVYVGSPSSFNDTSFKLFNYFNPVIFPANNAAEEALYNGVMQIMINNNTYVKNWPLSWHRMVNQTQQTAALGAGSPEDQFDGTADGFYPQQPFVLLLGSSNLQVNFYLPNAITALDLNSGTPPRVILVFDGILAQNSTVVN